jgi:hypothetical protein
MVAVSLYSINQMVFVKYKLNLCISCILIFVFSEDFRIFEVSLSLVLQWKGWTGKDWESSNKLMLFTNKASFTFSLDFCFHILFYISFVSLSLDVRGLSLSWCDWRIINVEDLACVCGGGGRWGGGRSFDPQQYEMLTVGFVSCNIKVFL